MNRVRLSILPAESLRLSASPHDTLCCEVLIMIGGASQLDCMNHLLKHLSCLAVYNPLDPSPFFDFGRICTIGAKQVRENAIQFTFGDSSINSQTLQSSLRFNDI